MSLREQIRQRAAVVERQNAEQSGQESADERVYREQMLPALRAAAEYFGAIVDDLEIIQSTLRFTLPLGPQTAPDVKFRQSVYQINVDNQEQIGDIMVSARCEITAVLTRNIDDLRSADAYEEMLRERGLTYFRRRSGGIGDGGKERSHFTVEGHMPCGFTLQADVASQRILVRTQNLEDRPVRLHTLAPERVNEELFESLGRLLLREHDQLLFTQVSDEVRQQLRERAQSGERWLPPAAANSVGKTTGLAALKQSAASLAARALRSFSQRRKT